jgi:hypothetical protein
MIISKVAIRREYERHLKMESPTNAIKWTVGRFGISEQQVLEAIGETV